MKRLRGIPDEILELIGAECVYKERSLFLHVQILRVDVVDETLEIKMQNLATEGFGRRSLTVFEWSCVLEYVVFRKNRIDSPILGSELFYASEDVEAFIALMKSRPTVGELSGVLRRIRRR
jgi:hypothetical protein